VLQRAHHLFKALDGQLLGQFANILMHINPSEELLDLQNKFDYKLFEKTHKFFSLKGENITTGD